MAVADESSIVSRMSGQFRAETWQWGSGGVAVRRISAGALQPFRISPTLGRAGCCLVSTKSLVDTCSDPSAIR